MELIPRYMDHGAEFSECADYRFRLWRRWGNAPMWLFLMLNPSTADEIENDPTVERCCRRARQAGAGGIWVGNLFALRSTDPRPLYQHPDPVGPGNDKHLLQMASDASMVICAWGATHGGLHRRGNAVAQMLIDNGLAPRLHALKVSASGHPGHPLYLSYQLSPKPWTPTLEAA